MLTELGGATSLPIICKPNAGLPDPVDGHYSLSPEEFAREMQVAVECGVAYIGGCCGTSPEYIAALKRLWGEETVRPREIRRRSCVCTPTRFVPIEGVRVIGERVNPTGKKRFQQALLEKDLDYIAGVALQEMDAGAEILDVNVGYPGVDEKDMLPRVVKRLQAVTDLPLQLDSSDPEAL